MKTGSCSVRGALCWIAVPAPPPPPARRIAQHPKHAASQWAVVDRRPTDSVEAVIQWDSRPGPIRDARGPSPTSGSSPHSPTPSPRYKYPVRSTPAFIHTQPLQCCDTALASFRIFHQRYTIDNRAENHHRLIRDLVVDNWPRLYPQEVIDTPTGGLQTVRIPLQGRP